MDLNLSPDIQESFRIFQGKVQAEYEQMAKEFGFTVVDATRNIHEQQQQVREIVAQDIDLGYYQQKKVS
jgi:dTMP kinase